MEASIITISNDFNTSVENEHNQTSYHLTKLDPNKHTLYTFFNETFGGRFIIITKYKESDK